MPHQCLQCGHAFAEGSSAILRGCPECQGTRFFYTQDPVSEDERKRIASRAQRDLREVVAEVLQDSAPEFAQELRARAGTDGWASIKPKDLRRMVREVQEGKAASGVSAQTAASSPSAASRLDPARGRDTGPAAPATTPATTPTTTPAATPAAAGTQAATPATTPAAQRTLSDALRRLRDEQAKDQAAPRPDNVTVHEPGDYELDVKGLLERNPIVVQKDGAYLIHLPSLFGKA